MSGAWANKNQTKALEIKMARERERETKNVPFKKLQSLTLSARASFCDIASQWISFHCARITFLPAAQVCGPFFVRPVAKSTPHKYWAHIECV